MKSFYPAVIATTVAYSTIQLAAADDYEVEELLVISERLFSDTTTVSPTSVITELDLARINIQTVEDALAYEPSLVIRRRYIGDSNSVIGIRGSNMFQGTRSMVFVDGMPLHFHLQTRFSGSPRWSLVSPSEIKEVEVVYGPFSAEYSGNAMGGVVNVTTKTPQTRQVVVEGALFSQEYDLLNTDERFNGGKFFVSYADTYDKLSVFASYNHVQNDSQPQTHIRSERVTGAGTEVTGAVFGSDEFGNAVAYYGDTGIEEVQTDLYKLKLTYDLGEFELRTTIAYEERQRDHEGANNFLTDAAGQPVWGGTVTQGGESFSVSGSNFQNRHHERNTLLLGVGLSGRLNEDWIGDIFYSNFDIVDDAEVRTARSPSDPDYLEQNQDFRGRLTQYDDSGWQIFDLKLGTENLAGNDSQRLSIGAHTDSYKLNIIADDYNSISGERAADEIHRVSGRSDSGGEVSTEALFAQYGYALSDQWDLALGLRYESWESENGYSGSNRLAKRSESGWSPKFSIAYFASEQLTFRYSAARALRFPIVEELYRNDSAVGGGSVFLADPNLKPEDGIFHNLSVKHDLEGGSLSLNIFYDVVEDVIFNQSTITNVGTVTTSLPTDEVTTFGAEFGYQQQAIAGTPFNIRYNLSYIDAEITENTLNQSYVGNDFPRMPKWRSNVILGYDLTDAVNVNTSARYASDSTGRLDNGDNVDNVFGAQDGYLFVGAKANWQVSDELKVGFGMDNIFNEEAYVFHPWPGRTIYLEAKYVFEE